MYIYLYIYYIYIYIILYIFYIYRYYIYICIYIYIIYIYIYIQILASIHNIPTKWNSRQFQRYMFILSSACNRVSLLIIFLNTDIYKNTQTTQGSLWLYLHGINALGRERDCSSNVSSSLCNHLSHAHLLIIWKVSNHWSIH